MLTMYRCHNLNDMTVIGTTLKILIILPKILQRMKNEHNIREHCVSYRHDKLYYLVPNTSSETILALQFFALLTKHPE